MPPHTPSRVVSAIVSTGILSAAAFAIFAGFLAARQPPAANAQYGAFAFPDLSGTRLLAPASLPEAAKFHTALCDGGTRVSVRFERLQARRQADNGRQTARNFDNLAGNVFRVLGRKLDIATTCFLTREDLLASATVLPVESLPAAAECTAGMQRRIASARRRGVARCWTVANSQVPISVALVEFERRNADALASVILIDRDRMTFADYPAEFHAEGEDLWRVDDGGVLSPAGLKPVFLLQREKSYVLGINWSGTEGDSLTALVATSGDRFAHVLNDYWYRAPL